MREHRRASWEKERCYRCNSGAIVVEYVHLSDLMDSSWRTILRFPVADIPDWIPDGQLTGMMDNKVRLIITYVKGIAHGPTSEYWSNGLLASEGNYHSGMKHGDWRFYNQDGTLEEIISFDMDKEISSSYRQSD